MCAAQSARAKRFNRFFFFFFPGTHSLLRVKLGQHKIQRLCTHLTLHELGLCKHDDKEDIRNYKMGTFYFG